MIRIDTTEMALRSKSHSAKDFDSALQNGGAIWILDSGTSGKDDYLIYGEDTTVEEIMD